MSSMIQFRRKTNPSEFSLEIPKEEQRLVLVVYVQITILSNDDAYGVVGFAQVRSHT